MLKSNKPDGCCPKPLSLVKSPSCDKSEKHEKQEVKLQHEDFYDTQSDNDQNWFEANKHSLFYFISLVFYCCTLIMLVAAFLKLKCKSFDYFKLFFFVNTQFTFGMKIK